ncbi:MAG: hypothetical protein ABIG61_08060 [Planctomycetota bacterium]
MDSKFFNSLYEGDSANGVKLCMGVTGGDFWPRPAGCQNLYRGFNIFTIDFQTITTTAEVSSQEISPPLWLEHEAGGTYYYVVRRVNSCGKEEHSFCGSVKVAFDDQGNLIEGICNGAFDVKVSQIDGDRVELLWFYWPIRQGLKPGSFRIYGDGGSGTINYNSPLAEIAYAGQRFYEWQSCVLAGNKYLFAIRMVTETSTEATFMVQVIINLDRTSPEKVAILQAKVV